MTTKSRAPEEDSSGLGDLTGVTKLQIALHQSHKATELPVHRTTEPSPNGNSLNKHCSICNLDHKFHA